MIKPVTMYSVVCDRCGKQFIDEFNGIVAWLDEGTAKEAPNYEEWILTEWYDGDDGGLKYETDYLYSFIYWKDYVKRNNITKWCYIKDIKD